MSQPSITVSVPDLESAPPPRELPDFITVPRRQSRRIRWMVAGSMALLLALVGLRLFAVTGWWRTVRIDGASMAETFLGAHFDVVCDDCGVLFPCDGANPPRDGRVVCPNCGYRWTSLNEEQLQVGDRVLIDRWRLGGNIPQRGEVVALEGEKDDYQIKRVVALPGERWGVRDGDLYIDGKIFRKSLHQLLTQRILVHDNNHQPKRSRDLPPRWQSQGESSRWKPEGSGFVFEPAPKASGDSFDWLRYTHWRCSGALQERTQSSAVFDNDFYNQALSRNLNWTPDVMLTCTVECDRNGRFSVAAEDEPHHFEIVFDRRKRSVMLIDHESEQEVARSDERIFADAERLEIVVALCDQQVIVAEGGQTLITFSYRRYEPCENKQPLSIGGNVGRLKVTNLRVYRDIYHLDPAGTGRAWEAESAVPRGHVAVLGDNPPISIDSRHTGSLPLRRVLGTVYRPFWITPHHAE